MQPVQDLSIDTTVSRTQYQFVLEDANPDEFNTWVPKLVRAPAAAAAARGRGQRPGEPGAGRLPHHRPRHRRPLRHHPGHGRQRALRRLRPAHRLDDLHAVEPVPRHPAGGCLAHGVPRCARHHLPALVHRRRRPGAAVGAGQGIDPAVTAVDRPPRPVPCDHRVLQPRRRRRPRRRGRCHPQGRDRDRPAAERADDLPGCGARLPGHPRQRAVPDHRRHRHRLHRARGAVRELHPPDHHPLDPALGRRRGAAGAAAGALGPRRHRHHRHHSPDRHRQEERHHDDRLRAGGRARAGHGAARGHLPAPRCCASGRSS